FAIMLVGFFLACQVRRENLAFAPLLLWFEVVGERGFSFSSILNQARRSLWTIASIGLVAVLSEFVLHLTNYLTEVNSFFGHVAAAPYLHVGKIFEMFHRNGMDVLFGQAFGLFYWKNLFAILPALLVIMYRRSFRIWFPLVCTVMLYCTLCILYEWPNGMDWQNRFLLKLNPIFFTALVYQMGRSSGILRWVSLSAVLMSAFFELDLYMAQLPYGMSFYIHQFSDQTFLYPPSPSNWNIQIFYLPLIILFVGALLAIAALAFKEYKAVSRSRGLSVGAKR
ncbi:MAG: hypothetical protein NT027_02760, partial [Proteobacteria bacterium]|nr:hypothetical protein [Pseudomonadota bacterium]